MGSVKDLLKDDSAGGRLYVPPILGDFGQGAWKVSGRFSVGDLKEQIPESNIANKAQALTMMTAAFFEWLATAHPDIPTCYLGVLDNDGNMTDTAALLQRGDTSDTIVMKLAEVPETHCMGNLDIYRAALASGELQCGVADIESIFRKGFPLGSSTFKKIFGAAGMEKEYEAMATYGETVDGLGRIRHMIAGKGLDSFPKLEALLQKSGLGTTVPNPGFVLDQFTYNTTTKFEAAGDRDIGPEEERKYSGLDDEGYQLWKEVMFPGLAQAQIDFCGARSVLNIDGKGECVAYNRKPVVTDFACTCDENRLMIIVDIDGTEWAIPSNKEIQRAVFRQEGVYAAISEAKQRAEKGGNVNKWKGYFPNVIQEKGIDLQAVTGHSCNLMAYAVAEVGNRILGKTVFDAKPVESWARDFLPYASKIQKQDAA
jgi:phosphoribosylaminoimidazole-succinocarboxamide synthase